MICDEALASLGGLRQEEVVNPLEEFRRWFDEAVKKGLSQPEAMAFATSVEGRSSVRYLLMRGVDANGIGFYTNKESRKARDLARNPFASAAFFWEPLGKQVRMEGRVEELSDAENDAYFRTRPRDHQLGAWASPQSSPISRENLAQRYAEAEKRFEGGPVQRPPHWGGYRLVVDHVELWTMQPSRLHIREIFTLKGGPGGGWSAEVVGP